ncbi:Chromo domain-containing protein [Cucumis melo var. makuwa]|uniref:Chromo domain-containing protein n=1 Tax=Cucumis melo var. makuwa TaxID=1194695 RepID=A0A5D3CEY0_CUCMM|nr:Chromo domain-containing protein [Cucumis melo var. makuwa]TYK08926.1 Chromo domain-containing protein [Cucumis melo var. makuwa]
MLRNRGIALVKVLWRSHGVEEATWEREEDMRAYSHTPPPPLYRPSLLPSPPSAADRRRRRGLGHKPSCSSSRRACQPFTWSPTASSHREAATDDQLAAVVVEHQPQAM